MRKKLNILFLLLLILLANDTNIFAQCAMCKASMENSLSTSSDSFSAGLNIGILYLFIMPYIIISIIGLLWYRASKKNAASNKVQINN